MYQSIKRAANPEQSLPRFLSDLANPDALAYNVLAIIRVGKSKLLTERKPRSQPKMVTTAGNSQLSLSHHSPYFSAHNTPTVTITNN
jgi:hypothetical protein